MEKNIIVISEGVLVMECVMFDAYRSDGVFFLI